MSDERADERAYRITPGPFRVEQLRSGDRYELHEGNAYYCDPAGGDCSQSNLSGGYVLDSDPDVEEAGVDAGYAKGSKTLWAPDVAVGNVPNKSGWIEGAPSLAVEYAGVGQDELKLKTKISELFLEGTRWVWVVRMTGPRRVEVYEPGQEMHLHYPGEELTAPGVLRNPVPVEALYDRKKAREVIFRNLLQRQGYNDLEDVREQGREQGRSKVLEEIRASLYEALEEAGVSLNADERRQIEDCQDASTLTRWIRRSAVVTTAAELFEKS